MISQKHLDKKLYFLLLEIWTMNLSLVVSHLLLKLYIISLYKSVYTFKICPMYSIINEFKMRYAPCRIKSHVKMINYAGLNWYNFVD